MDDMAMAHSTALALHAVDRYALGDLSEDEANAFEAHFFECAECSREVRETMSFVENARVAFKEEAVLTGENDAGDRNRATWSALSVLPWAAVLILGAFAAFQAMVTVPHLRAIAQSRSLSPTVLRVVRAEEPVVEIRQPVFNLVIDITAPEPYPNYRVEFENESGETVLTVGPSPPELGLLSLFLLADDFPDGRYTATLSGVNADDAPGQVLEQYRFRVSHE